jgi:hypothetical protein
MTQTVSQITRANAMLSIRATGFGDEYRVTYKQPVIACIHGGGSWTVAQLRAKAEGLAGYVSRGDLQATAEQMTLWARKMIDKLRHP